MLPRRRTTEQDIRVMVGLLDARLCLQRLHGVHYAERIQPWIDVVRAAMTRESKPALSAVLRLCEETSDEIVHLWLMAAGVEVIDADRP